MPWLVIDALARQSQKVGFDDRQGAISPRVQMRLWHRLLTVTLAATAMLPRAEIRPPPPPRGPLLTPPTLSLPNVELLSISLHVTFSVESELNPRLDHVASTVRCQT